MKKKNGGRKRFLVAPLDWGLGHAARCIPVVRALLDMQQDVVIAASGNPARFLSEEFPQCAIAPITNYRMTYTAYPFLMALKFPFMVAKVYRTAPRERHDIERLVEKHDIDVVISDQRFGCHTTKARSIYITHQLCVKMPPVFGRLERLVARKLREAAGKFDEVWIPDYSGSDNLTGDLTRKYPLPPRHRFIGPLSRFDGVAPDIRDLAAPDILVMLSGPEPQRSVLERIMRAQLAAHRGGHSVMLLGRPERSGSELVSDSLECFPHLSTRMTAGLLHRAAAVVCRGGYTTIMELVKMGKRAVLIPTPGQTEQEYLCGRMKDKGLSLIHI